MLIAITALGAGILLMLFPEPQGFKRQALEASLALDYVQDIHSQNSEQDGGFSVDGSQPVQQSIGDGNAESAYEEYGYTPDYAIGSIQCVLDIPSVKIRRGVYGGSWEAIEHDLAIWMLVSARPDYKLGMTHYCIYGHNHPVEDLSFNRIKEVKEGDFFTLTSKTGIFTYRVTRIFADSKENVTDEYVDNFSLTADNAYIITCGRGEFDNLDLVVEGSLSDIAPLSIH